MANCDDYPHLFGDDAPSWPADDPTYHWTDEDWKRYRIRRWAEREAAQIPDPERDRREIEAMEREMADELAEVARELR